jgi:hypothetical protein
MESTRTRSSTDRESGKSKVSRSDGVLLGGVLYSLLREGRVYLASYVAILQGPRSFVSSSEPPKIVICIAMARTEFPSMRV